MEAEEGEGGEGGITGGGWVFLELGGCMVSTNCISVQIIYSNRNEDLPIHP